MDEELRELFDLYLTDIIDNKDSVPNEFIVSSKVIFLSNSTTLPSRVKPHTLSFVLDKTFDQSEKELDASNSEILTNILDETVDAQITNISLSDFKSHSRKNLSDFLKILIIRSSGLPDNRARSWIMEQK